MAVDAQGRTVRRHSGEGLLASSLIQMLVMLALVLVSFYLFVFHNSWWFLAGIAVYGLALLIPTALVPSKTAQGSAGGTQTLMDLPASSPRNISTPPQH